MTPFELIALKQRIGKEYAEEVELIVLLHFDAARRNVLGPIGYNFISRHLFMAQYIFARLNAKELLPLARDAGQAWQTAGGRPGKYAGLTTPEYTAMRAGLQAYFRTLPRIEVGTYRQAYNVADRLMGQVGG